MKRLSILTGKAVQKISKLRGGGSALPGYVIEKTDPDFLKQVLGQLPLGIAVVSGTNGKTTTTRIVTELLEKQGLRVFTNRTGSNFVRGIISAVLEEIGPDGTFDYDIAVLELDEAHCVRFLEVLEIDYALLLNIQRDQLDRFCETDYTAGLLAKPAAAARKKTVLNREDPLIRDLPAASACYYGLSRELLSLFPSDEALLSHETQAAADLPAEVVLERAGEDEAVYRIDGREYACHLSLKGIYNAFNAAGALALCRQILPDADPAKLVKDLSGVTSAFGRGEVIHVGDTEVQLLLVKNPSAFQLSIASFADEDHTFMIIINDHDADGHDVSWLWNVDFSGFSRVHTTSGTRAADMALRLKYDEVPVEHIEEDIPSALQSFLKAEGSKRIFVTYTALLEVRKLLTGRSLL